MENMIDIHSHLIPRFDDGPKSFEESLKMLRHAAAQGISAVFATSHFNEYIPPEVESEYQEKLQQLQEKVVAKKIPVTIYPGAEIFYHHFVEKTVKMRHLTTLGNWGQYVLIEFPMFQMPDGAEEVLFRLNAENYIPIVAHPERYVVVINKPARVYNFIRHGGLLQLNGGSILGHFGKDIQKTALYLLNNRLAHFIASDAHSPDNRPFVLREVFQLLKDRLPEDYLEQLLWKNQMAIIDRVALSPVSLPELPDKTGFLQTIKNRFKNPF